MTEEILMALAFLTAFAVSLLVGPWIIRALRRAKAGQVIQEEGPESHASKAGTPAMGGIIILVGLLISVIVVHLLVRAEGGRVGTAFVAAIVLMVMYALLGMADDWLTIRPRNGQRGISSKPKFLLQLILAAGFVVFLALTHQLDSRVRLSLGCIIDLGWAYAPLAVLFITGMANFVNITDGLDGLAAGLGAILAVVLGMAVIVGMRQHEGLWESTSYQTYPAYLALAGACVGFLWYNFNPAKVFMGDTGSLAIGAVIPALAIVGKVEIVMIVAGLVFILDGLSSALQWAVFKYTRIRTGTGRRIFKMSPVHHHFELCGWPEQNVVIKFWIVGAVCGLVALAAWWSG